MNDKLAKHFGKKRDLRPIEKDAKMNVVKHLRDMASDAMGSKLDGLRKVSVMSDSPEGLKHGLEKAKEVVSNPEMDQMVGEAENPYGDLEAAHSEHSGEKMSEGGEVEGEEESPEHEASETPQEENLEHNEFEGLDLEDIDQKLQKLMELKKKMEEKKS